ncbi:MAG TPA: hypothetical protein PK712_01420 [Rectinema sp.]|nr:hypothetical protein [Rectinema sp.]
MPDAFPQINREMVRAGGEDRNPAVQLFGRRFFADQTVTELLVELLLVAASEKLIGTVPCTGPLPSLTLLRHWPKENESTDAAPLKYAPRARLNLKLFSFLGASKLESRHETHRRHYEELLTCICKSITISGGTDSKDDVLRTLENLFLGFQGVGGQRTWCAQSFLPLCISLIAGESIWKQTKSRQIELNSWEDALDYFSHSQQIFLARGGELLYLQLCNVLHCPIEQIRSWTEKAGLDTSADSEESNPELLHQALSGAFLGLLDNCPKPLEKLAEFIDTGIDKDTQLHTDSDSSGDRRYTSCGWCPEESWQEGYLFALEFVRLCHAQIDHMEKLQLLELLCAMQVLRSILAQSARYADWTGTRKDFAGPLGYSLAVSDPDGSHQALKQISRRSVRACERMIFDAIRHPEILARVGQQRDLDRARGALRISDPYNEADSRYGYKFFLALAKRIGLIIPRRGKGARFVVDERILRLLILTVLRPGERVSYETFKRLVFIHYGMAFDDMSLSNASQWSGGQGFLTLGGNSDEWLMKMLDASGVLIRLSDSCAMVESPSDVVEETRS